MRPDLDDVLRLALWASWLLLGFFLLYLVLRAGGVLPVFPAEETRWP